MSRFKVVTFHKAGLTLKLEIRAKLLSPDLSEAALIILESQYQEGMFLPTRRLARKEEMFLFRVVLNQRQAIKDKLPSRVHSEVTSTIPASLSQEETFPLTRGPVPKVEMCLFRVVLNLKREIKEKLLSLDLSGAASIIPASLSLEEISRRILEHKVVLDMFPFMVVIFLKAEAKELDLNLKLGVKVKLLSRALSEMISTILGSRLTLQGNKEEFQFIPHQATNQFNNQVNKDKRPSKDLLVVLSIIPANLSTPQVNKAEFQFIPQPATKDKHHHHQSRAHSAAPSTTPADQSTPQTPSPAEEPHLALTAAVASPSNNQEVKQASSHPRTHKQEVQARDPFQVQATKVTLLSKDLSEEVSITPVGQSILQIPFPAAEPHRDNIAAVGSPYNNQVMQASSLLVTDQSAARREKFQIPVLAAKMCIRVPSGASSTRRANLCQLISTR